MKRVVISLFKDTKNAGEAIADLKTKGYIQDISVVAKKEGDDDVRSHQLKQDVSQGTQVGAVSGGVAGAFLGLLAGLATVVLPGGLVLTVAGPLTLSWIAGGTATGALGGGLIGALVDWGLPEEKAKLFSDRVLKGEAIVAVTIDDQSEHEKKVFNVLTDHQVESMESFLFKE